MECGVCGAENPGTSKFCGECGQRLAGRERREERKVVTVLFADLAGFTSRSERLDVEEVRGTLATYHASLRQLLESFGGTVEKFIGDAVMAVFGAPVAHEDDAERAVRAGLAIRDALADLGDDLHVRVGINTGEALVSVGAEPQSGEGMVAGDVVNTAARLQSAAPVDGVLVGEVTFRAAQRQIIFEATPPIDAKGKADPVACWIAVEPRAFVPFAKLESLPLVGRERERRLVVDAFEHCRAEGSGQMVTVVGVPGIGKTRLIGELRAYVEADVDLTAWRHGQVLSYGSGVAFFALAQIVKQECGILDSDDARVAGSKLDAAIVALGLGAGDARWVRNQVGPLVGMGAPADGSGRAEAFAGWRLFFEAIAARAPTVLVVEDLHWADDGLLDFVDELVDRVGDVPLLVVASARPELFERRPGWGGGKVNALTIGLGPLSTEHTTALITEIIDPSLLPDDVEAVLLERAGGNPLYALEYVRALVERGGGIALPETVQGIIAARLDGLSAAEKSLIQDAAVIGPTVWLGAICALGERDRSDTDELLLRLERKQLLRRARRSSIAGEIELSFAHGLTREVAYSQLPRQARAQRHQRAAAWLERVATDRAATGELIAHHYTSALELETALGNDTGALRPAALTALSDAARQAAAHHDQTAVVRYTETALALEPEAPLRAELLARRAIARYAAGNPDESFLLEARDAAVANGRVEDAVHLTCLLCQWAEYYATDTRRTLAYDAEALALAADLPPGPIASLPAYQHAYRLLMSGPNEETITFADAEITRATDAGAESAVGLMLIWRGAARAELDDERGIDDLREAVRILDEQAHPKTAVAAYNLADILQGLGRLSEASVAAETSVATAQRYGDAHAKDTTECERALLAFHRGDPAAAFATIESVSTDTSEWVAGLVSEVRGRLLLDEAPHESAEAARRHLAYARRTRNAEAEFRALALAAQAELAMGNEAGANSLLDEYLELWEKTGGVMTCSASLVEAGLVLAVCDRHDELAAAADRLRTSTPWTEAAHALAERRYADAADILDSLPSIPLRDAARMLSGRTR